MVYRFRVGFADVDYARIVFFGNHYLWMDRAMEEKLLQVGIEYRMLLDEQKIALPIVESHCSYTAPLRYGDEVTVPLRFGPLTPRGLDVHFQLVREEDGRRAAAGWTKRRFVDLVAFRGISLPDDLYERFAALESDEAAWIDDGSAANGQGKARCGDPVEG